MPDYDPAKHHRHTIRLSEYDYTTPGDYYITICTKARTPYFDDPVCRNMVEEAWKCLPQHFSTVRLDTFAILPDHIHAILWLTPTENEKPTLGSIVRIFKAEISRNWSQYILSQRGMKAAPLWQQRYYDHIIRDDHDLQQKRLYILNNPIKHAIKRRGYE